MGHAVAAAYRLCSFVVQAEFAASVEPSVLQQCEELVH